MLAISCRLQVIVATIASLIGSSNAGTANGADLVCWRRQKVRQQPVVAEQQAAQAPWNFIFFKEFDQEQNKIQTLKNSVLSPPYTTLYRVTFGAN